MSNNLSPNLIAQMMKQESEDPFLSLLTLSHPSFSDIHLVNNTEEIVSNGTTFLPFPFRITLPTDDGETQRQVQLQIDNVDLSLMDLLRTVTDPIDVNLSMVLASNPDYVELNQGELKIRDVSYGHQTIQATLFIDDFLNTELSGERYTPQNFPGIFS